MVWQRKAHTTTVYDITEETEETPAETMGKIATEYSYSSAEAGKTSNSIEKYVNRTYNGDSESVRVFDGYSYEYDKQYKTGDGTMSRSLLIQQLPTLPQSHQITNTKL